MFVVFLVYTIRTVKNKNKNLRSLEKHGENYLSKNFFFVVVLFNWRLIHR